MSEEPKKISVLFSAKDSVYETLRCYCFGVERDAFSYDGNNPVIAHPPCNLWGRMARVNFKRWGGDHNRPGNDGGKFAFALSTVNRCGGVLEHPADSYAWVAHGLIKPEKRKWTFNGRGWVCEAWQSAYGHRANKRTWLYYRGRKPPIDPDWGRPKGTHQIGFHDQRGKVRNKPTLGRREASATPVEFAKYLIRLAVNSGGLRHR